MEEWTARLSRAIVASLTAYKRELKEETIRVLAVDCAPWNGVLSLAVLTEAETLEDPLLEDPAEMAAWNQYDFAASLDAWATTGRLAIEMKRDWTDAAEHAHAARRYFRACAAALATDDVRACLREFSLSETFRTSVTDPDTGDEFVTRK